MDAPKLEQQDTSTPEAKILFAQLWLAQTASSFINVASDMDWKIPLIPILITAGFMGGFYLFFPYLAYRRWGKRGALVATGSIIILQMVQTFT